MRRWSHWLLPLALALSSCGDDGDAGGVSGGAGGQSTGGASASGAAGGGAGTGGVGGSGAASGAGGNAGSAGSAGSGSSKLIVVDPAHRAWLAHADGSPHFLCAAGDPEGFLYRGTRLPDGTRDGDQMDLINKIAPTGANGIYLMAVRSHGGDGKADENPFVDSNPTKGLDDDILNQWETWFSAMDAAGVVIYFFFYDDSTLVWNTGDSVGAEEQAFVEALVDRFEHHDHLVWVIAEEYSEKLSKAKVSKLAEIIRAADDRDHVIGVHQLGGLNFDFPDDPNIDQFTIQYNVPTADQLHQGMVQAFGAANGTYNLNMSEAANHGTGALARHKNWAVALGGAYVMVFEMDIASTAVSDLQDCGRLRSFMESTRFFEMAPHDELASGDTDYVLAKPGEAYIAYANGGGTALGIGALQAGNWTLDWFSPSTGSTLQQTQTLPAGNASLARPPGFDGEVAMSAVRQ
jgi:hypothetical protein